MSVVAHKYLWKALHWLQWGIGEAWYNCWQGTFYTKEPGDHRVSVMFKWTLMNFMEFSMISCQWLWPVSTNQQNTICPWMGDFQKDQLQPVATSPQLVFWFLKNQATGNCSSFVSSPIQFNCHLCISCQLDFKTLPTMNIFAIMTYPWLCCAIFWIIHDSMCYMSQQTCILGLGFTYFEGGTNKETLHSRRSLKGGISRVKGQEHNKQVVNTSLMLWLHRTRVRKDIGYGGI